jgi:hypothetical protein
MLCVKALVDAVQEMASIPLPAYGTFYHSNVPINPKSKIDFADEFVSGLHCGAQYCDCAAAEQCHYGERKPNQGPCTCAFIRITQAGFRS